MQRYGISNIIESNLINTGTEMRDSLSGDGGILNTCGMIVGACGMISDIYN